MPYWIYILFFILVYLFYLFFVILRKKKLEKFRKGTEILYLEGRYKIDLSKENIKKIAHLIAGVNAFILTFTLFLTNFVDSLVWKLVVAFVALILLIIICYYFIGIYYQKKGKRSVKNGKNHKN